MRRWFYIDGRSLRLLLRQLQHLCGEINVNLLAIAIGLAILDYTYFLSLRFAAALHTHEREHQESTLVILPRHCCELFDHAVSVTGPRISAKGAKSPFARGSTNDRSPPRAEAAHGYQASCVDDPVEARAIWYVRRGRVRSCVRPTLRGLMTAGPDAIRSLAPKQIYALEWRITLDGFLQAPGSTGSPSRHHRPHSPISCGNR